MGLVSEGGVSEVGRGNSAGRPPDPLPLAVSKCVAGQSAKSGMGRAQFYGQVRGVSRIRRTSGGCLVVVISTVPRTCPIIFCAVEWLGGSGKLGQTYREFPA